MKNFLCLILSFFYLNLFPVAAFAAADKKVPDYQNFVNLEEKDVIFTTKLSNKYIGKTYTLTNNFNKPIVIKAIELKNNRGIVPVYKNSRYIMTPGSLALNFVGGFLAIPTFGISLALTVPATAEITVKNNKVKKEAKDNISDLSKQEITLESGKAFYVKAIFDKTQALNRIPDIKFTCYDSENKQEFVITANAEDEKTQENLNPKEEAIRQLTDSGLKPNSKVYAVNSIVENDSKTLGLFIDAGMNPNTKYMGMPLIVYAIEKNKPDIAALLLDKGVNPNIKCMGMPLIVNAVVKNKPDIVMLLIDKGVDVNTKFGKMNALQAVIYKNHPEIAVKLLEKGANPNASGFGSEPALFMAVKRNQVDVVKMLLEKGANLSQKSKLLEIAHKKKYTEIEKLLVNY